MAYSAGSPIGEQEALSRIFAGDDAAVLKFDGWSRGRAVIIIRRDGFRPEEYTRRGNFVVQSSIRQSADLAIFEPSSVATIRVSTGKHDGAPASVRGAYLRIGRGGNDVVSADRSVRVAITDDQGNLGAVGALSDWRSCTAHPDSRIPFSGKRVPAYREAVAAALALHERIPHIAHIGWNLAVSEDGALHLMEWNTIHPDIRFSEAATGPHFADLKWERLGLPMAARP